MVTLILFSLFSLGLYYALFRYTLVNINQTLLQSKADNIAQALSRSINYRGMLSGSYQFLRFLYDSTNEDVWIIDINKQVITRQNQNIVYADLPLEAQLYVEKILENKTSVSQAFNSFLSTSSLTAGSLLYNDQNEVIGVVLLHSPLIDNSSNILVFMSLLLISFLISLLFAYFVAQRLGEMISQPLAQMMQFIQKLAKKQVPDPLSNHRNEEMAKLNQSLNELSILLKDSEIKQAQLDKMRKDLLASVSHELYTPITVLRGFIEAIEDDVIHNPDDIKQSVKTMNNQILLLQHLVSDLLELTRLENPDFSIKKESIDFKQLISDSVEAILPLAHNSQKHITLELYQTFTLLGDYNRLMQMLFVFLNNAIKYSESNSRVLIQQDINDWKKIIIIDEGLGISQEDLPYVFDMFYKGANATSTSTGLGLAIAKRIADKHFISISLHNIEHGLQVILDFTHAVQ